MTELLELRGVVEAAPDAVAAVLLDVRPGGRSPLAVSGQVVPGQAVPGQVERSGSADRGDSAEGGGSAGRGGDDTFVVVREGSRITVTVDRAARSVTQQGEWWYRGVTSVEPDPRGSVVVHRIYNVAPGNRWAVRMVSRGPLNAAPTAFATQLEQLSGILGAAAWVIPD